MEAVLQPYKIFTALALAGSVLAELFGGWDQALQTLVIFMAVDWITGGILLPAVFRKSPKSPNGALESRAGANVNHFFTLLGKMFFTP